MRTQRFCPRKKEYSHLVRDVGMCCQDALVHKSVEPTAATILTNLTTDIEQQLLAP